MGTQNLPARRESAEVEVVGAVALEPGMLPASKLIARSELVQEVLRTVMRPGVDYGRVPGTNGVMLLKPGAEKIGLTFGISAEMETIEATVTENEVCYRVRAVAKDFSGRVLATAESVCSTREKKYRWRRPVCKEEFEETPASCRQTSWIKGKGNRPPEKILSVRMEVGEVIHTCLAMAQKRAYTAVMMRSTGASDIFAEEELEREDDSPARPGPRGPGFEDLMAAYDAVTDQTGFQRLEKDRQEVWGKLSASDKELMKRAVDLARERITPGKKTAPDAQPQAQA